MIVTSLKGVVFFLPCSMTTHYDREHMEKEYPGVKTIGELAARIQEEKAAGLWKAIDLGAAIDIGIKAYGRFLKSEKEVDEHEAETVVREMHPIDDVFGDMVERTHSG